MLSDQEQFTIRYLSDTLLYEEAKALMEKLLHFSSDGKSKGGTLSSTQINGLLNVSLANTYANLRKFVVCQGGRTTWQNKEEHIQQFYATSFFGLLDKLETDYLPKVLAGERSNEDIQMACMALAREVIQHLLAENAFQIALKDQRNQEEKQRGRRPDDRQGWDRQDQRNREEKQRGHRSDDRQGWSQRERKGREKL